MAPAGWARLSRWHARDWMRLIWQALKSNTQGRASRLQAQRQRRMHYYTDDTFTLTAIRHKHSMRQSARKKIGDILWSIYYETSHDDIRQLQVEFQDLSSPMLKWQWEGVTDNVGRLIHANHCLIQYIRTVYRPSTVAKHAKQISTRKAKWHICAYLVRTCLLYTSPSPRDGLLSRMPSSA